MTEIFPAELVHLHDSYGFLEELDGYVAVPFTSPAEDVMQLDASCIAALAPLPRISPSFDSSQFAQALPTFVIPPADDILPASPPAGALPFMTLPLPFAPTPSLNRWITSMNVLLNIWKQRGETNHDFFAGNFQQLQECKLTARPRMICLLATLQLAASCDVIHNTSRPTDGNTFYGWTQFTINPSRSGHFAVMVGELFGPGTQLLHNKQVYAFFKDAGFYPVNRRWKEAWAGCVAFAYEASLSPDSIHRRRGL
jgi:hypothetical protein